ncbi:hypothetical protein [Kitasatospora mediocidica]|uniref:hypothetical protein n=1 Tax=Kitasatospora mediocidica TaxID=58352 RepID=UPI0012FABDC0|nr:hypothetical protein [Kitasatospora mediocidica]
MPTLPNQLNTTSAAGSQWATTYTLQNDDGTLMNIVGKSFEFVVRPSTTDVAEPALVAVNSTTATAQGYITVTPSTSTVQVVLSPTATALLGQSAYPYSLWMDPGLTDATDLVVGTFFSSLVAAA